MQNTPRIHRLKTEIAPYKKNKQHVVDFFSGLKGLWNKLDNYVKILACTCGVAVKIAKFMEEEKVRQFLMGLDNDSFLFVHSEIFVLDPLPSIDKIYNRV